LPQNYSAQLALTETSKCGWMTTPYTQPILESFIMTTDTILIIVVVVILFGGGGWYWRGRG
jgi:hypothetical protein